MLCWKIRRAFSHSSLITQQKKSRGKPHPRNAFTGVYDMERLIDAHPVLKEYVIWTRLGEPCLPTIKFADPDAVRALNSALLIADYNVSPKFSAILPPDVLLPPVPGRADYVHHIADMLQLASPTNTIPYGANIVGIDIGTGASAIYPTLAASIYGWKMIASEIIPTSIKSAKEIVAANGHAHLIDVRHQGNEKSIFEGILQARELVDFAMCNPPFYPSMEAFQKENARKLKGLAKGGLNKLIQAKLTHVQVRSEGKTSNNFGGLGSELWCEGGEVSFVNRIIKESKQYANRCLWFSSIVSRKKNLKQIEGTLFDLGNHKNGSKPCQQVVKKVRRIHIGTGHKTSTILLWSFLSDDKQKDWARMRNWK